MNDIIQNPLVVNQQLDTNNIDIINSTTPTYFVKRAHQRTENTPEQW